MESIGSFNRVESIWPAIQPGRGPCDQIGDHVTGSITLRSGWEPYYQVESPLIGSRALTRLRALLPGLGPYFQVKCLTTRPFYRVRSPFTGSRALLPGHWPCGQSQVQWPCRPPPLPLLSGWAWPACRSDPPLAGQHWRSRPGLPAYSKHKFYYLFSGGTITLTFSCF